MYIIKLFFILHSEQNYVYVYYIFIQVYYNTVHQFPPLKISSIPSILSILYFLFSFLFFYNFSLPGRVNVYIYSRLLCSYILCAYLFQSLSNASIFSILLLFPLYFILFPGVVCVRVCVRVFGACVRVTTKGNMEMNTNLICKAS